MQSKEGRRRCCGSAHRHRRKWTASTVVASCAMAPAAVFLYSEVQPLHRNLNCLVSRMLSLTAAEGSAAAAALGTLTTTDVLLSLSRAVPYFDFAAMTPAALSLILLLLAAVSSLLATSTRFCVSKCFVGLTDLSLIVCLAWYIVLAGGGLFADRPLLANTWNTFSTVCDSASTAIDTAIATAQQEVETLVGSGASPGVVGTAQAQLAEAEAQGRDFSALCVCLDTMPDALKALAPAGIVGLGCTVLALVCVNGLCCANGCCKRAPPARVAPDPDLELQQKGTEETAEYDEDEDAEDDDY
jgi:hypothetical protein